VIARMIENTTSKRSLRLYREDHAAMNQRQYLPIARSTVPMIKLLLRVPKRWSPIDIGLAASFPIDLTLRREDSPSTPLPKMVYPISSSTP
jgi:hypothetical protein